MDILRILYFIFAGLYGNFFSFLKQSIFQGRNLFENPLEHLKDLRFVVSTCGLLFIGLGTWFFDAYVREKFHLSEMMVWGTLITTPISVVTTIFVLWLSEKYLADKINWVGVAIWITGVAIATAGASLMLRR